MRKRSLVRAAAVVCGLALLTAACGSDDNSSSSTTTTAPSETPTGNGELVGAKGTTPAPETTDAVTAFQDRMDTFAADAGIDLANTYAYGPESYDSAIIIALAAQVAGDDGAASAGEIVNVTKGGTKCSTYADCLALVEAGTDIDYEGVSGPTDMSGNGEPIIGSYAVQVYGDDNRLDDPSGDLQDASRPATSSRRCRVDPVDGRPAPVTAS